MGLELPSVDHPNFKKVLDIKQAAAQGILTASVRVRQDQLRPQQSDHMAEVLRRVRARKLGLPEDPQGVQAEPRQSEGAVDGDDRADRGQAGAEAAGQPIEDPEIADLLDGF